MNSKMFKVYERPSSLRSRAVPFPLKRHCNWHPNEHRGHVLATLKSYFRHCIQESIDHGIGPTRRNSIGILQKRKKKKKLMGETEKPKQQTYFVRLYGSFVELLHVEASGISKHWGS